MGKVVILSDVVSSPAIADAGTIDVGSAGGKLFAIKPDSMGLAECPWPTFGRNPRHTGRVLK
ncbi:MAG TPA: hypothetical protein DCE47_12515 [Planctomycetaceae bacterium]|nr:hypothetical protein [Planctomycetaceae bacterium]|tara:strand:+ start:2164 stop:2349 length:186 start_codon:yes stop_codon:yes gene_type:complete